MKKTIALLLVVLFAVTIMIAVPTSTVAATNDFYEYKILYDNTAEITGYVGTKTNLSIPQTIDGYTVSSIGKSAFYDMPDITKVTIPDSVTRISQRAFSYCYALKEIIVPDSVSYIGEDAFFATPWYNKLNSGAVYVNNVLYKYKGEIETGSTITIKDGTVSITENAFNNNWGLKELVVPDSVAYIGANAFYGTQWYESHSAGVVYAGKVLYAYKGRMNPDSKITVKDGTVSITDKAFADYSALKQIVIPQGVRYIGAKAFDCCTGLVSVDIPDSVVYIGEEAFSGCNKIEKITLGNNLEYISEYAFNNCTALTEIVIPQKVKGIGMYAFSGCSKLKSAQINAQLTRVENSLFYNCVSLKSVKLPQSVRDIEKHAFMSCKALADINIPLGVVYVGGGAFSDTLWLKNQPDGLVYINDVLYCYKGSMPENMVIKPKDSTVCISGSAFYMCDNLVGITIPDSVVKIEDFTFSGCSSLSDIVLPESLISIGTEAFKECQSLKGMVIPSSVKEIKGGAFTFCSTLTDITILNPKCSIAVYDAEGSMTIPKNTRIHGYNGSTAEKFAKDYGYTFVSTGDIPTILGDVDGDNEVSVMDATAIQMRLANLDDNFGSTEDEASPDESSKDEAAPDLFEKNGDVDKDGVVSIMDATRIQFYLASMIEGF